MNLFRLSKLKYIYICISILLFIAPTIGTAANALEVRKITPPRLTTEHLGKRIVCHRPMRHGSPKMELEVVQDKLVVHNYGHGGSGWTLGPGSAEYVNNLLTNSKYAADLKKNTPITIIGAGALGLFTAYDLYQRGYKNITIVAEKFESLTSHNAGGLIAPVSMNNDPEMQKIINKIGVDAYKFFASIARKQHLHFKEGAVLVPSYWDNREESGLEPYVEQNVMQPAKDVVLDFSNGTTRKMVSYDDTIFVDAGQMMESLSSYLKEQKLRFVQAKVKSFAEITDKYIINCSGLGAKELNDDKEVVPVQGHLIMLKNQNAKDLQHMILIYLDEGKTKFGQKVKRSFYMFPKKLQGSSVDDVGVIGGTFIEGGTPQTPNEEEFDIILENTKKFYGIAK